MDNQPIPSKYYTDLEEVYLHMGSTLPQTYELLEEISDKIVNNVSNYVREIGETGQQLDTISSEVQSLVDRTIESQTTFNTAHDLVRQIIKELGSLKELIKVLQSLRTNNSIQMVDTSNEQQEAVFFDKELKECAEFGNKTLEEIFYHVNKLASDIVKIVDATDKIKFFFEDKDQTISKVIESIKIESNLSIERANDLGTSISSEIISLNESISKIITCVQFQDSYRQRLEHIAETKNLAVQLKEQGWLQELPNSKQMTPEEKQIAIYSLRQVGNSQLHSLADDTKLALEESYSNLFQVRATIQSFRELALSVAQMVDTYRSDHILHRYQAIVYKVKRSVQKTDSQKQLGKSMTEKLLILDNGLGTLDSLGRKVFKASINALILSNHIEKQTPDESGTLNVIAESVKGVSKQLRKSVVSTGERVDKMKEVFSEKYNDTNSNASVLNALDSIQDNFPRMFEVESLFFREVLKIVDDLTTIDASLTNLLISFQKLASLPMELLSQKDSVPETTQVLETPLLEEVQEFILNQYTMNSERTVHDNALNTDYVTSTQQDNAAEADLDDIFF